MNLLDAVRAALAPDYAIEDELARGGMGVVYRARDTRLARTVAIKVIRPERATAAVTERFLREARILAALKHPSIVAVYHAGEAEGIAYYVMAYLAGTTLGERLVAGPLPPADAAAVGLDLLGALAAAHTHGVVHRDVKPANILLENGRAVLTDFGISKTAGDDDDLTLPGHRLGTAAYMPPEQHAGGPVDASADVYAAGAVLYEAWTGRRWAAERDKEPGRADWSGVPPRVVPVLARALAAQPAGRWPDAAAFRRALARAVAPRHAARRAVAAGLAVLALGALGVARARWNAAHPPARLTLALRPFGTIGAPPDLAWLGDSLRRGLERNLSGMADFAVVGKRDPATTALTGTVTMSGDSMAVRVRPEAGGFGLAREWRGPWRAWPAAIDSLSRELLVGILTGTSPVDLPREALPLTTAGVAAFADAETRYARSEWDQADAGYRAALRLDSTCLLCEVRLADINRWRNTGEAPAEMPHILAHLDRLPAPYQLLIRAGQQPLGRRLATLEDAVRRYPDNGLLAYALGDELMLRGPLAGRPRSAGLLPLERAVQLRPAFSPALADLARLELAEGNTAHAHDDNERYRAAASPTDQFAQILYLVNAIGWVWRFGPSGQGAAMTSRALADPMVLTFPSLNAGVRYFLTLDQPDAALWLGRQFAARGDRPGLLATGLVGQAAAELALGRRDSALADARQLALRLPRLDATLFAAELEAMLLRFDSLDAARWPAVRATLQRIVADDSARGLQRRRAAWMLALAGRAFGDTIPYPARLDAELGGRSPFAVLIDAALSGPPRALQRSAPLLDLDSAGTAGDPFFRAALHLLRAEWSVTAGRPAAAIAELRWHENSDLVDGSPDVAQAIEVDAAFGTLARWRRAQLLDAEAPGQPEACKAWTDVARLWAGGDPPLRSRAAAATAAYRRGCTGARAG